MFGPKMGKKNLSLTILRFIFLSILLHQNFVLATTKNCSSNKDCPGSNEICSRSTRRCICREETQRFAGACLRSRSHGESCQQQYECAQSKDGHLHCVDNICQCGNQRIYDETTKKCEANQHRMKNKYNFKKMAPHQPRGHVQLDEKYKDISHVR